jgi:hypothetical protein
LVECDELITVREGVTDDDEIADRQDVFETTGRPERPRRLSGGGSLSIQGHSADDVDAVVTDRGAGLEELERGLTGEDARELVAAAARPVERAVSAGDRL